MFSKKIILLISVLILIFSVLCCSASARVTMEGGMYVVDDASGYAPVKNGQKAAARNEAIRMAYRDALEKALGACVTGITEMENFAVTRDKVFSKSTGIVKDFKILEEKVDKDGVLNIVGKCRVSEQALDGVLGPDVIAMLGNPRIMILIDERIAGKVPFISSVESELLRRFEQAGYLIVDPDQAKTLLHLDPSQAFDDPVKLAESARTLRADIIVVGRAVADKFAQQKIHGIMLYGVSGTVQLKAVLTQTAYQVSSKTVSQSTGKKPAQTVEGGAERVFKSAASIAADQIVYKIAYNMASAGSSLGGITVNIKIAGATFRDVENIEEHLSELAGKSGEIFERSYNNNLLEIDIVSENTARKVASFLSDLGVDVEALTAQTISAKMVRKQPSEAPREKPAPQPKKSKITVTLSDVDSFDEADSIEETVRELVGSSSEISGEYENKTLILTIMTGDSSVTARKIASGLSKVESKRIVVDGVSSDSVKGHIERKGGLW